MTSGIIFDIKRFAVHDGPGIRTTLFLKGCGLRCWWCHNPEGMHYEPVAELHAGGACPPHGPDMPGRKITVAEAMREIKKDLLFYDESGGGVTFSGGEPLMQPEFLGELIEACRKQEIHVTLDTSGHAPAEVFDKFRDQADLFLYDLKLIDEVAHEKFTGVSNRLILRNLAALAEARRPIAIRFPIIPDITDTPGNIRAIAETAAGIPSVRRVHLLPYHRIASGKYERLGMENRMGATMAPSSRSMDSIREQLEKAGLKIVIGG